MSESSAASDPRSLELTVEKLRMRGYIGFWVVVLVGVVLTKANYTEAQLADSLLVQVFGYNNICVYFDFSPSNRVLPVLWAFTLVFLLTYIVAHWLQMRGEVDAKLLTPAVYRTLSGLKGFEAITLIVFTNIFAVSPHSPPDATLWIHTTPFFLLQFGMVSLAMSNTLHGIKSGYWRRLGLPDWFFTAAKVYCGLFALVVLFKVPYGAMAMANLPADSWAPEWLQFTAWIMDHVFLLFAAIVPMLKAGYLLKFKHDELEVVRLTSRVAAPAN